MQSIFRQAARQQTLMLVRDFMAAPVG